MPGFSLGKAPSPAKEEANVTQEIMSYVSTVKHAYAQSPAPSEPEVLPKIPSHYPDPNAVGEQWGQAPYKILRLQEAADLWKGTSLEDNTVSLLALLLQEDGSMTAERRHDCIWGVCYAFGIMGHHICQRGTPLIFGEPHKVYCSWKGKKSPQKQFEEDYPEFATEWRVQFAEYTLRMTQCLDSGKTEKQCMQSWNPNESGRIAKIEERKPLVRAALGL